MVKQKRGKVIKSTPGWRGTCPLCGRKRVRLLWTARNEEGHLLTVCKICGAKAPQKKSSKR